MFIKEIDRNDLLKPLLSVYGIVERKQPLPILSNILVKIEQKELVFIATDLEIQISAVQKEYLDSKDQSITISAKKLLDILKILPEHNKVSLEIIDAKIVVKSDKSRFKLQSLPAVDFPIISPSYNFKTKISIKQNILKKLIALVQNAMAQQDIRYYLNGVLLLVEGEKLKLIATDGHRLAYAKTELDAKHDKSEIILSRKTINELQRLLNDSEELVTLEIDEKFVQLTFSNITLVSKIIDGKFPDYERVIPSYSNKLHLNRINIFHALQRAAILSNEKFRGIRIVLTEKNLSIVSNNSEQEEAQEDIECNYQGQVLDIGFNVNYLLDGLGSVQSETVTFSFGDTNSSILISADLENDYKYVVMPMRI